MGFRKYYASAALPLILLLIAIIFIAFTASSVITSQTTTSQEDIEQYLDDTINDLTSYLKIQNIFGKYSEQSPFYLTKIAIQATPLFHQEINITNLIIQIQTNDELQLYTYDYNVTPIQSSSVFSHSIWTEILPTHFGILVIQDNDESLIKYHSFSEPNDIAFFTLSVNTLSITKGEYVTILLSPGIGIEKTITFRVPLPTKQVVCLW